MSAPVGAVWTVSSRLSGEGGLRKGGGFGGDHERG